MKVTDQQVQAAVKEAVRQGLLPKAAPLDDYERNYERVRRVLEAALSADD